MTAALVPTHRPGVAEVVGLEPVVVASPELLAQIDTLEHHLAVLPAEETPDSMTSSDPIGVEAARLAKDLEAERVRVKAAPWALCQAIDAAARGPADRIAQVKGAIEQRHRRILARVEAARQAAEAARREAERKAAEAVAARERAEAQARRAQAERDAALARMAADATTAADRQAAQDLAREAEAQAQAEAAQIAAVADREREAAADAYLASLDAAPPPAPRSSTTVSTHKVIHIYDAKAVPDAIVVGGVTVYLKTVDAKQVEKLLRIGVPIAGARLVDEIRTATRTGRGRR